MRVPGRPRLAWMDICWEGGLGQQWDDWEGYAIMRKKIGMSGGPGSKCSYV